jgi:fatty-acyl-CoA synthase
MPELVDYIAFHARLAPHRLAARDLAKGLAWTYAELDDLVGRMAGRLAALGCADGERVAVLARNSVWLVALHHACARTGAILVPLNWRLSQAELEGQQALVTPRLLLVDGAGAALLDGASIDAFAEAAAQAPVHAPARIDPDAVSLILTTSGTSGQPKGVMLTERNLEQTALNFAACTRIDAGSRFLCEAPMFHVIGLVTNVRPVLRAGGALLVSDGFEPQRTLAWLTDAALAITHYVGVPQMMEAFRTQPGFDPAPLRRMTALVTGGAPHAIDDILAWLADGVPMVGGFGMSEAGTVFGMSVELDVIRAKPGSVGIAAPGIETRVVDGDGRVCAAGEAGELLLRGASITPGYWRNPLETAKAFDRDGWFATGDIVRHDEDGFFWIVDRKKDMFISGGENIYPAEIEAALADHPGIAECALVGLPDPRWGEAGWLAIVPADPGLQVDAVLAHLEQRLARYKLPRQVVIVEALPRTATGKLQKAALKRWLAEPSTR